MGMSAGHQHRRLRYLQPSRDRGADKGDVAVAHADEIESDEGDSRLAVAQDEGAGERVVVDATRGTAQVAVVAAQVEALLQLLGEGRAGEGWAPPAPPA